MSIIKELIPKDYGYVLLAVSGISLVSIWHGTRVTSFRKAAKIKYPKYQADSGDVDAATTQEQKDALYLFNCAQRAHYNFLENQLAATLGMVLAGIEYPKTAAALGAGWTISRILFAIGYTDKNKANGAGRYRGSLFWVFQIGIIGLVGWSGVKMLM